MEILRDVGMVYTGKRSTQTRSDAIMADEVQKQKAVLWYLYKFSLTTIPTYVKVPG